MGAGAQVAFQKLASAFVPVAAIVDAEAAVTHLFPLWHEAPARSLLWPVVARGGEVRVWRANALRRQAVQRHMEHYEAPGVDPNIVGTAKVKPPAKRRRSRSRDRPGGAAASGSAAAGWSAWQGWSAASGSGGRGWGDAAWRGGWDRASWSAGS